MDDEELAEYRRLAEVAAGHLSRYRELMEQWLADPARDRALLRRADVEGRRLDRALADVYAFIERVLRRGLS